MADFQTVKEYVQAMGLMVVHEDAAQQLLVVDDEDRGISRLVIDCEDPIIVCEQAIIEVPAQPGDMFQRLLQLNRTLVHGAFVLTEDGRRILFRDTLRLAHLDLDELQGTIEALSLALAEHAAELIALSQH